MPFPFSRELDYGHKVERGDNSRKSKSMVMMTMIMTTSIPMMHVLVTELLCSCRSNRYDSYLKVQGLSGKLVVRIYGYLVALKPIDRKHTNTASNFSLESQTRP